MTPDQTLKHVQSKLPGVLFVEASRSERVASATLEGGPEIFVELCHRVGAPVVLYERFPLSPYHFLHQDDKVSWPKPEPVDLSEAVGLRPFQRRLGETVLLVLSVPHGGAFVDLDVEPKWLQSFYAAKAQALEVHQAQQDAEREARQQQLKAEVERELQLLRTLLPEDSTFRRLACEAKPRITALRERAEAVLREVIPDADIHQMHDETIREAAANIKAEVRAARRR